MAMSGFDPKRELRSPRETLGGLIILPRLIDKVRAHARGVLPPEYVANLLQPGTTLDGRFLTFTGLEPEPLRAAILAAADDAAVLAWVERHAQPRTAEERRRWAEAVEASRPDPARVALRRQFYPALAGKVDLGAIGPLELIDLDEGRVQSDR